MEALQVTDASLTPVVVNQLQASQVPHLRHLYIGGEAPSQSIIDSWADHVRLSNIYGTSETGIWDTFRLEISRSDNAKNIGRGIDANCWVVNPSDVSKLQPVGVKGELLIQTPFLGRGYLGDNATSANAFLPAPNFASLVGGDISLRCYRTGDLARYEQDGSITYCGRESGFIKIRGFRVDLGEVEIAVNSCLDHRRAAVIAAGVKDRRDALEIIACVEVGNINARSVSASELSERLRSRLPRYMVPTVYIPLPELPCNQSKKIDRPQLRSLFTQLSPTGLVALRPGGKTLHQWPKIDHRRAMALEISKSISDLVIGSQDSSSETLQGLDFSLSSVGLNSMQLVYLANWIHQCWQRSVSVQTLLQPGITVCQLEEHLLQDLGSTEGAPQRDILLELDNLMQSAQFPSLNIRGRTIFLTSMTGFLGTQILRFLLSNPEVDRIVGLVRADSETDAREKIHAQATAGGWWKGEFDSRIIVWLGDLKKPKLGLNQSNWDCLRGRAPELHIDGIIHDGARANWLEGYNRLKAVNVDSTITLLQAYSCRPVPCPFTYVSGGYLPLPTDTSDQIGEKLSTASGYDQTKYLSRLIIEEYNSRLESRDSLEWPRITIVQPGFIVGTRWEGIAHAEDFLWRLAYCIVSLGAVSEDSKKLWIPVAGADQIASIVIAGMFLQNPENVVDCRQGITVHEFCDILSDQTGFQISTQNHQRWLASLREQVDQNPLDHPFTPLLQWVGTNDWQLTPAPPNQSNDGLYRRDTVMALEKNVQYLMGIGFLPCRERRTVVGDGMSRAVFRRSKD
ncbi:uncharacterized protein LDX57_006452 [Aspergillus melleus]|uniref:uncharacterized protein n=1 Tax=Aspergillus melleus TaxID=138277 RepID=UPI001E8EAB10|nr:uncharacterized protein LDX57_006452 [Aspergillus melleus]KAH8428770.1 hypothetical protein LDX57_006452 [Aspergillus melleus]